MVKSIRPYGTSNVSSVSVDISLYKSVMNDFDSKFTLNLEISIKLDSDSYEWRNRRHRLDLELGITLVRHFLIELYAELLVIIYHHWDVHNTLQLPQHLYFPQVKFLQELPDTCCHHLNKRYKSIHAIVLKQRIDQLCCFWSSAIINQCPLIINCHNHIIFFRLLVWRGWSSSGKACV